MTLLYQTLDSTIYKSSTRNSILANVIAIYGNAPNLSLKTLSDLYTNIIYPWQTNLTINDTYKFI